MGRHIDLTINLVATLKIASKINWNDCQVRLYEGARVVLGTTLAVNYGGSKLHAEVLGPV